MSGAWRPGFDGMIGRGRLAPLSSGWCAYVQSSMPLSLASELTCLAQPFEILAPDRQTMPVVFSSPHSGRDYAPEFLAATKTDLASLRQLEDSFVDELFAAAPDLGAPLLRALFPRAFIDPNREPYELDPEMYDEPLPDHANTSSFRVSGGLGTIARVTTTGAEIYRRKLRVAEAEHRIAAFYQPFHDALEALLAATARQFGHAVLIDCHSMPSIGGPRDRDQGRERADIVLGDRFGTSCAAALTETVEASLAEVGCRVTRNVPYAGGYTTHHYGRPEDGIHALQIELNRSLYMDQRRLRRHKGMARTTAHMRALVERLGALDPAALAPV